LERAAKFLRRIAEHTPRNLDVCFADFDVAIRRKKYLQAVQALARARAVDPAHPELHVRIVDLRKTVSSLSGSIPEPSGSVLTGTLADILPEEVSLETYNSQYLQQHSQSGAAIFAVARVYRRLDSPREEVESLLFTALGDQNELSIKTALEIISFLRDIKSPRVEEFRVACDTRFTLSTVFKSPEDLLVLRQLAINTEEPADSEKADVEVVG